MALFATSQVFEWRRHLLRWDSIEWPRGVQSNLQVRDCQANDWDWRRSCTQRLVREFEADPAEMWRLQAAHGDPTLAELNEAKECTEELRRQGELRPRRRRRRVDPDDW